MKVGRFMEAHSVLCAYAALVSCYLLEYEIVVELCTLFEDDVHMKIAVTDMAIAQNQRF